MKAIAAIKKYFPDVSISELKALNPKEREELGRGACEALGEDFESSPKR